jgi:hypothetical protein
MNTTSSQITEARALVQQMPSCEAARLRRLLSIPCGARKHARLIARERLPLGALVVADAYRCALAEIRSTRPIRPAPSCTEAERAA